MKVQDIVVIKSCFISHLESGDVFSFKGMVFLKCQGDLFVDMEANRVYEREKDSLISEPGPALHHIIPDFKQKLEVNVLNASLNLSPYPMDPDDIETKLVTVCPPSSHLIGNPSDGEQGG